MIDHSECEHPSTPGARAKCRRQRRGATPKEVDLSRTRGPKERKQQTPRDRDKQCMNCGVEPIVYRGTDPLSGILLFVGERCEYMVRRSLDRSEVD